MRKGAIISKDKKHRYRLWRIWDDSLPKALFIMLNPSTADAMLDDPTIRRCIGFAKSWGYGGIYVGNIFSLRSSNPKDLISNVLDIQLGYCVADRNEESVRYMADICELVVCAWGNSPILKQMEKHGLIVTDWMYELVGKSSYLAKSKDGTPKHPLYLKKDLKPIEYKLIF